MSRKRRHETIKMAMDRRLDDLEIELTDIIKERISNIKNCLFFCEHCGELSLSERSSKKFCSDNCRAGATNKKNRENK